MPRRALPLFALDSSHKFYLRHDNQSWLVSVFQPCGKFRTIIRASVKEDLLEQIWEHNTIWRSGQKVDKIEIIWPSGIHQVVTEGIALNSLLEIEEESRQ